MNHLQVQMELPAYAAGRLDESSRRRVAEHLAECEICRELAMNLRELAQHVKDGGEAMFEPHPSEAELREFSKKSSSAPRERIARHLTICASCALEVDAWRKMDDKEIAAGPAERVPRSELSGTRRPGGMRAGLAAAAGLLLGVALGYVVRERTVPQPSVEESPSQGLPSIGPQLLLPRPLRGEPMPLEYRIEPRQEAMILACPASIPESAACPSR